ncbi:uncharacterized protein [Henckelia pumila]|uniref:uncharacterized protein n=1 Tax=Henckelia pumila TaxID=405737 RepID=UPI003C6E1F33
MPTTITFILCDDSLIFFKASMEEGARVRECLARYERASGQCVNFEKSTLSFSPNTNPQLIEAIKAILTISVVQRHDLYLGLPTVSMRSKKMQFKYLLERLHKRINGWGHKDFSKGGKEVLIKSVLQVVPTSAMPCFKIPVALCEDIEKECANFWWGVEKGKRKMVGKSGKHFVNRKLEEI